MTAAEAVGLAVIARTVAIHALFDSVYGGTVHDVAEEQNYQLSMRMLRILPNTLSDEVEKKIRFLIPGRFQEELCCNLRPRFPDISVEISALMETS